jgi:hypothetical protein
MSKTLQLSRRDWHRVATAGVVGGSLSGWIEKLAAGSATNAGRKRSCILLWMNGGPSQMDTFDLKPGHANGGPFKEIETSVPGVRISEHLPKIAKQMREMAILRSMSTKEADHGRATFTMRTGYLPNPSIQYPAIGSVVARELDREDAELPGFVSIAPFRALSPSAFGAGFLGPQYAPLIVGEGAGNFGQAPGDESSKALKVPDLEAPAGLSPHRSAARIKLHSEWEQDFLAERPSAAAQSHHAAYRRAVAMMRSKAAKAFDLDAEKKELRDSYGQNLFGQGCLLARRLVESGVPFVEVTLSAAPGVNNGIGWDTHQDNFTTVQKLSQVLDAGWSTLMADLKDRGLLDSTLVVWMGEFGRSPKIDVGRTGRDHWATSWSTVLAGGGIKGGQVVGRTSADGAAVEDRPVTVRDFLATVCQALGLDVTKQNTSNVGRPIRLVDTGAEPVKEVLA